MSVGSEWIELTGVKGRPIHLRATAITAVYSNTIETFVRADCENYSVREKPEQVLRLIGIGR